MFFPPNHPNIILQGRVYDEFVLRMNHFHLVISIFVKFVLTVSLHCAMELSKKGEESYIQNRFQPSRFISFVIADLLASQFVIQC